VVVGAIVFSLLAVAAYLAVFGLVFADAIVPIFPGETTLTTASIAASQDKPSLHQQGILANEEFDAKRRS
jgi:membrane protein DedA with SNARE-associated domain